MKWDPKVLDNSIDNIEEWASKFEEFVGTSDDDNVRHDMKDNPYDERGYYIDRALTKKDPPILRIQEDANRISAQRMESVFEEHRDINRIETIDLHAEDKGEERCSPPIDTEHEDAEFGDFLYQTPFTDREDIIGNVPVTYSVNRAERQITETRYSQL